MLYTNKTISVWLSTKHTWRYLKQNSLFYVVFSVIFRTWESNAQSKFKRRIRTSCCLLGIFKSGTQLVKGHYDMLVILRRIMCGIGWTISQEFIPRPLHFRAKCISAYLTAEWATFTCFNRFKFSPNKDSQSCVQGAVAHGQSQLADVKSLVGWLNRYMNMYAGYISRSHKGEAPKMATWAWLVQGRIAGPPGLNNPRLLRHLTQGDP